MNGASGPTSPCEVLRSELWRLKLKDRVESGPAVTVVVAVIFSFWSKNSNHMAEEHQLKVASGT